MPRKWKRPRRQRISSACSARNRCLAGYSTDSEYQPGHDAVAVLNYGFWQRHFAGDPSVLGRQIELDQRVYTIVGVMPKTMQYPSMADLFLPFAPTPQQLAIAALMTTS